MSKKPNEVDLCCCCGKELPNEQDMFYINFRYQVPGIDKEERILVSAVCDKCSKEAEDPNQFPVIEALINARVIRIAHPEKSFVP